MKKEIINNEVDVSKCIFYKEGLCCLSYAFVENGYDCVECCECNDCDYKQLQRKTKEYEELKKREKYLYNFLTNKYNYGSFRPMWGAYLLQYLFNEDLGDFFNEEEYAMSDTIKEKEKEITNLRQECEELKTQIETYSKILESPEFNVALTDVRTGEREIWRKLGNKAQKYKQALDKIEEYCKEQNLKYDTTACIILDIISKAKEGNNE